MIRRAQKGRALAWGVPMLAEAAALGRSVAFAWAIGPDELGRAMMLALTVRLVEMASDLGADRLMLQARDGNSAALQAELQGAFILRGLLGALVLLAAAPMLAALFADGPAASSYALLALVPLLRGFTHLDFRRAERGFPLPPHGGCRGRRDAGDGGGDPARRGPSRRSPGDGLGLDRPCRDAGGSVPWAWHRGATGCGFRHRRSSVSGASARR